MFQGEWPLSFLLMKANTRNISFETLYSGQFTLSTQLINYPVILSHWRSTTVCLETYPLYSVGFLLQSFLQNSFTKRITYNYLISLCLLAKGVGGLGEVNYTWCFTENWNRLQLFPASLIQSLPQNDVWITIMLCSIYFTWCRCFLL